jgi:hypothetical protein
LSSFASPAERRRERRTLCSNVALLSFRDQAGKLVAQHALVEDVSGVGVCLSSSLPAPVGSRATLQADGFQADGAVCYCRLGDYSFLIGLRFAPGEGPAERGWRPDHLLDLDDDEPAA